MSSIQTVSTGQAMVAIKAALNQDSIEQEGKMALQLLQSASTATSGMNSNQPDPSQRVGGQINISV